MADQLRSGAHHRAGRGAAQAATANLGASFWFRCSQVVPTVCR